MGIVSVSVHHKTHGLDRVAQVAGSADSILNRMLESRTFAGGLVLTTCNRVDFYLSTDGAQDNHAAASAYSKSDIRRSIDWAFHSTLSRAPLESVPPNSVKSASYGQISANLLPPETKDDSQQSANNDYLRQTEVRSQVGSAIPKWDQARVTNQAQIPLTRENQTLATKLNREAMLMPQDLPSLAGQHHMPEKETFKKEQSNPAHFAVSQAGESGANTALTINFGEEAVLHIFRVAAGLDSMVVGEREISGQLKRAHVAAQRDHTTNSELTRVIDSALSTSRKVAHNTGLAGTGRSIVTLALDLISQALHENPSKTKVLLLGTGSYAGATVAQLRGRQIENIAVYSHSGRAREFAQSHELEAVESADLVKAIAAADLVVSCRGLGHPIITEAILHDAMLLRASRLPAPHPENPQPSSQRPKSTASAPHPPLSTPPAASLKMPSCKLSLLPILDLSLLGDVQAGVGAMDNVQLITLKDIQKSAPSAAKTHVEHANRIITEATKNTIEALKSRGSDRAIVALREHLSLICKEEVSRLPEKENFSRAEVERALAHFAARLAHTPTVLAQEAAKDGESETYIQALHYLFGIDLRNPRQDRNERKNRCSRPRQQTS